MWGNFSVAARRSLSEWQLASADTRDAVLASMTASQLSVFETVLQAASLG